MWEPADDDPLWQELEGACRVPFRPTHKGAIQDAVNDYRFARQLELNTGTLVRKIELAREIANCLHRARESCTPRGSTADAGLIVELLAELEARTRRRLGEPPSDRPGQLLGTMTLVSDDIVRELENAKENASAQTYAWDHLVAMLAELIGAFVRKPQKLTSPKVVALVTALHRAVILDKRFGDLESAKKALADASRRLSQGNS